MPSCFNCKFFGRVSDRSVNGICRKFPPDSEGSWPAVGKKDWCGEFETGNVQENDEILTALHDAIRRPLGIVPESAIPFVSGEELDAAESRRIKGDKLF